MSTVDLTRAASSHQLAGPPEALGARRRAAAAPARAPAALGLALLLLVLYAAFAHGAVQSSTEARLQVAIAAVAAFAGGAWLWTGTLRVAAPAMALAGAGLLAAFAVWSCVTVLWSVAPDQTWIAFNRALTYVIVLGLALALGSSDSRAVELTATGFLCVALAVTAYALGQKLLPGLHVPGLFDLNQTGPLPRLQEPLGYWNALALFIVMGVPVALMVAADTSRGPRSRLAALLAVALMLLAIGFTYSRGGLLALGCALLVGIVLGGSKLRSLMWLLAACLGTVAPLIFGLVDHSLTAAGVSLGSREIAGGELTVILIASLGAVYLGGRKLLAIEQRVQVGPDQARRIGKLLLGGLGGVLVVAVLAVAVSSRGLDATISHAWKSFTATRAASVYDPHRLLSADSENRWVWWKEAAGAFSDRPVAGWGAGSFGVVHLLYRRDTITVRQPHSVPLQWLAETGIVGALLAIGGYVLLLITGTVTVRRSGAGRQRLLAAALLAGGVAYAVHALYDWDWDIPAVTLPALVFVGVLAGARPPRQQPPSPVPSFGVGSRLLALGALTLMLCLFAVSAVLPSLASSKASAAEVAAAGSAPVALAHAQASAELASKLNPLSDAGLRAEATIAIHRGQPQLARVDLLAAIRRQPSDVQAWEQLAIVELFVSDVNGVVHAASQVLSLDPHGTMAAMLAQRANLLTAPPRDSATAVATPLP